MGGFSDYSELKLLDHITGRASFTAPTNTWVALYTATPSDAGGGTELSGNGYLRATGSWAAAASGQIANSGTILFPTPSASWGTVTHFGIFDAQTDGNLLAWSNLTNEQTVAAGNVLQFNHGALVMTLD